VMLNNGSGAFSNAAGSPIAVGTRPVAVAVADFNGDHRLDIAVTNNSNNTVSILLNNPNGTFTNGGTPATGAGPRGIAAGDLDGDGDTDLVVDNFSANSLSILLNNGAGVFTASAGGPLTTGNNPYAVTLGRPRRRWRYRYRDQQLR
jgi:FG-GAP-like repeat